jgi:hypothetical protein
MTCARRSSVYDTRQSPTLIRNAFGLPRKGRKLLFGAVGSAATRVRASRMFSALAGCSRLKALSASRRNVIACMAGCSQARMAKVRISRTHNQLESEIAMFIIAG